MASKIPVVKGAAWDTYIMLFDSDGAIVTTPTIAAGDFVISKDGAATANLATLPSESPAGSGMVKISLSTSETNADWCIIEWSDAAGDEWLDGGLTVPTAAQTFDTMDTNIDSVLTDTAVIGALGAGLTAVPWNSAWDAEVQSEVTDALTAYDPPTRAELTSDIAGLNDLTAAQVNAEVDTAIADASLATAAALATVDGNVDAVLVDTNELQTDWTNGGRLDLIVDSILTDTNELQLDDVPGLIAALNNLSAADVNTQVDAAFTTQMADSVPADGTIPTREQAMYMLVQFLLERSVAGTTVTVKKVDGSTSLMTFTLNDGTSPTSITRAT